MLMTLVTILPHIPDSLLTTVLFTGKYLRVHSGGFRVAKGGANAPPLVASNVFLCIFL